MHNVGIASLEHAQEDVVFYTIYRHLFSGINQRSQDFTTWLVIIYNQPSCVHYNVLKLYFSLNKCGFWVQSLGVVLF